MQSSTVFYNAFLTIYDNPNTVLETVGISQELIKQTLQKLEISPAGYMPSNGSAKHLFKATSCLNTIIRTNNAPLLEFLSVLYI